MVQVDRSAEFSINTATNSVSVDITPEGISLFIDEIKDTGLDIYDSETSKRKRAAHIGERRPLIAQLDARLRILKEMYPAQTRSKKGFRQPDPGYKRASLRLREYRKEVSRVQSADRLTLTDRL